MNIKKLDKKIRYKEALRLLDEIGDILMGIFEPNKIARPEETIKKAA